MKAHSRKNPWLGLESYKEGEVLYGRDDDIRDLIQCVLNDVDTLLYGKSGIGKSSILNAGILPAARRSGYFPIIIRLSHKDAEGYLFQIREAILSSMEISSEDKEAVGRCIREVVECKDSGKESMYEFFHRHTFHDKDGRRIKLLIIFDQFEEIFTLQSDESRKRVFFAQMADLLNDIMPAELQNATDGHSGPMELIDTSTMVKDDLFDDIDFGINPDIPEYVGDNDIHFVFTIREDFLSEFEYYTASIPSLKQNRYGLRPINDEQASQIILRPEPGLIAPAVAKLIIEKVTGRTDFELDGIPEIEVDSAVLSLYLNRLYEAKDTDVITSDLVEKKGGEIISDFYNEAISSISQSSIVYLEDMLINGQGRRDNVTVYDAINEGGVTKEELHILCDRCKILRQFNYAGVLRIEYIHDILCPIVSERKERREEENRVKQIEMAARAEKVKSRRRLIFALVALVVLVFGVAGYFLYDWYGNVYPKCSYHIAYELRNGWPVGVGPELSEQERLHLPLYYELSHPGHSMRPFSKVKVCSSNAAVDGHPVIIPMLLTEIIPADSVPADVAELQSMIVSISFSPTADTKDDFLDPTLDNMAFYGVHDDLLFTVKLVQDDDGSKWFTFNSANGRQMSINENNIDRINVLLDSKGYVSSAVYYDVNGVKRPLCGNVFGYLQSVSRSDSSFYNVVDAVTVTSVNQFGQPTDNAANTVRFRYGKDDMVVSYFHKDNASDRMVEVANDSGYSKEIRSYGRHEYYGVGTDAPFASRKIVRDENGNILQKLLEDPSQTLTALPAKTVMTYDPSGRLIGKEFLDGSGAPFSPGHAVYKYVYGYSERGELTRHEELADTGMVYCYDKEILADDVVLVRHGGVSRNDPVAVPFHIRKDSLLSDGYIISYYFDLQNRPVNFRGDDGMLYHRKVSNKTENIEENSYYQLVNDELISVDDEDSYFRSVRSFDKDGNVLTMRQFDSNGAVVTSMMYFYDNGRLVGHAVLGVDDTPVRCDEWDEDGFLYYKLFFNRDFEKDYTDFMAVNEFSQPSLIYNAGLGYFNIRYGDFIGASLDCSRIALNPSVRLSMTKHYWQYYPEVADNISDVRMTYVHMLNKDNLLYAEGLRDGDVLFSCGSWRMGQDTSVLERQLVGSDSFTVLRIEDGAYRKKLMKLPRQLDSSDLKTIHFHNMKLSAFENKYEVN